MTKHYFFSLSAFILLALLGCQLPTSDMIFNTSLPISLHSTPNSQLSKILRKKIKTNTRRHALRAYLYKENLFTSPITIGSDGQARSYEIKLSVDVIVNDKENKTTLLRKHYIKSQQVNMPSQNTLSVDSELSKHKYKLYEILANSIILDFQKLQKNAP